MKKYGTKKASRPYEKIHKHCRVCCGYNETLIKTRRANEKKVARNEIKEQLD